MTNVSTVIGAFLIIMFTVLAIGLLFGIHEFVSGPLTILVGFLVPAVLFGTGVIRTKDGDYRIGLALIAVALVIFGLFAYGVIRL